MPRQLTRPERPCSVARTLDVLGDAWSLMILRDIFRGVCRFDDLQRSLGIASNILNTRLKRLSDAGILEKIAYSAHPPRYEYVLSTKGRDLYPVLVGLMQWGDTYLAGPKGPPRELVHVACGHATVPILTCPHCTAAIDAHSAPFTDARVSRKSRASGTSTSKR